MLLQGFFLFIKVENKITFFIISYILFLSIAKQKAPKNVKEKWCFKNEILKSIFIYSTKF